MIKVFAIVAMLFVAGELLYRKYGPKVKAVVASVESKLP